MLTRDTDWRQGDLLTPEATAHLGLVNTGDKGRRAVIVSHDCDIPHSAETCIEVIVVDLVSQFDPQLSYAKNPRRLHLSCDVAEGEPLILELKHGERQSIPKEQFVEQAVKDERVSLSLEAKRAMKQWLAARYGRPAFPNVFERRLRKRIGKRDVESKIAKILAPEAKFLVGLFFDLGNQRCEEETDDEPYALSILVVYDPTEGGVSARESAERVRDKLRSLFEEAYGKPEVATEIALDNCEAVPDTHVTLSDLRRIDQWRLEYVSLNGEEQGDFLPVGETPA